MAHGFQQFRRRLPRPFLWALLAAMLGAGPAALCAQVASTPEPSPSAEPEQESDEIAVPLPRGKKLILTDETFQVVREYHREGDRVRYYSVERSAWEEIPAAMVDWAATLKAELQEEAEAQAQVQKLKAADLAARTAGIESDSSFEVRPGVLLPDEVGLYVLSANQVLVLQQSLAAARMDKGRAVAKIITGVPLISTRHNIEIPGKRAKVRARPGEIEFYFRTADRREPRMQLLRTEIQGDKRRLTTMTTDLVGQITYKGNEVPVTIWNAARGLYRFTTDQDLGPGEYALVESTAGNEVDLYVWDFGVDATAGVPGTGSSPQTSK